MTDQKETIIFDIKVDEGPGAATVDKLTVSIGALTEANKKLRAERKDLDLATEAGIKRTKDINEQLDKNTKIIKDNSSALEKQKMNIGNYSGALDKLIPGLGATATGFQALLNPLTLAAVGVGSLIGLYAKSASGAKDLAFANNQLGAAMQIVANGFGDLLTSAEDGEGLVSTITNRLLFHFGGPALAAASHDLAMFQEQMEDLQRKEIATRGRVNERLSENQELLTEINAAETSHADKLLRVSDITSNLRLNQAEQVAVLKEQLTILEGQVGNVKDADALETKILEKRAEIDKVIGQTEKKIQGILRLEDNIVSANAKQLQSEVNKNAELDKKAQKFAQDFNDNLASTKQPKVEAEKKASQERLQVVSDGLNLELKLEKDFGERVVETNESINKTVLENDRTTNRARGVENQLLFRGFANLFGAFGRTNKQFASAQALINTYLGISQVLAAPTPPFMGPVAAAILKIVNAAAVGVEGFQAIRAINKAPTSFGRGGIPSQVLRGPSHDQGGIPLVAEGDEIILTKGVYRNPRLRAQASALNVAGGGRHFAEGGVPGQFETQFISGQINGERAMMDVVRAIQRIPRTAVVIEQVTAKQQQQAEIVERATIR